MKSSYVDSMRLILSEKYSISDKDYMTLSDILLSKGLSGIAFSGGLVQLINLMVSIKFFIYCTKYRLLLTEP